MLAKLIRLLSSMQQYGVICTPSQMDDRRVSTQEVHNVEIARRLIEEGVTVQEWTPISDPPKKSGRYLIYTTKYFVPDHVGDPDHINGIEISGYHPHFGFLSDNGLHAKYWTYLPVDPKEVTQDGGPDKSRHC